MALVEKSMEEKELRQMEAASLKRKLIHRVVIIAMFCIVISGGLSLLFYSVLLTGLKTLQFRQDVNAFLPGLFDIGLFFIFTILMTLLVVWLASLTLRKVRKGHMKEHAKRGSKPAGLSKESITEAIDRHTSLPSSRESLYSDEQATLPENALKLELESEKLLNNLLAVLLNNISGFTESGTSEILNALGSYCKSDFAALYKMEPVPGMYRKLGTWDSDPETARHSNKVDAIDLTTYRWMHKSLSNGKSFIFRTAMLEGIMESIRDADEDVKAWMKMQTQESAEHKLCKHEGWEYFACFPCQHDDRIIGLFLVGYQKSYLPVTREILERLSLVSTALGRQIAEQDRQKAAFAGTGEIQAAVDRLDEAIFITDTSGNITLINQSAAKLAGSTPENLQGKPWHTSFHLISAESRFPIANPVIKLSRDTSSRVYLHNVSITKADGTEVLLEGLAASFNGRENQASGIIFILRDITERRREEDVRCQTMKMEAVSSLASGFAHDFNNILTAILGNISLAMDDIPPDSEPANLLRAAEESTLRGKDITDKMLALAKSGPISEYSSEVVHHLERIANEMTTGTNVKPVFQFGNNLPNVKMAADTFEKIITNIIANSLQAMKLGGILTVSANTFEASVGSELPLQPGTYLIISIRDTGEGISRENQNRIFVPYFTTRPKANGLGLPMVYSLLKKHNGYIRLQSEPGKGTVCEIYIPATGNGSAEIPVEKPQVNKNIPLILVLDEDDALGNLLIKTLVKMGLRVQHTSDIDELSTLFFKAERNGTPVTLIVADLNLPGTYDTGALLQVLKKSNPKVKLIAYGNNVKPAELDIYKQQGFDDILVKPFNLTDLRQVIKRTLNI
jgi:PAS domain S-box-containing protein